MTFFIKDYLKVSEECLSLLESRGIWIWLPVFYLHCKNITMKLDSLVFSLGTLEPCCQSQTSYAYDVTDNIRWLHPSGDTKQVVEAVKKWGQSLGVHLSTICFSHATSQTNEFYIFQLQWQAQKGGLYQLLLVRGTLVHAHLDCLMFFISTL